MHMFGKSKPMLNRAAASIYERQKWDAVNLVNPGRRTFCARVQSTDSGVEGLPASLLAQPGC
jgi:hypothetical protein